MPRVPPRSATLRYEPGFGRSVSIAEYDRPMLTDDVETAQTIALMDELADRDAATWTVIEATHQALAEAGESLASPPIRKACAIYWWLKRTIRYVPTPGTSPLVDQTLIAPATMLQMPDPEGDCPQFSMLASAMLRVCCVPTMYRTIAAEPTAPQTFSHVYNVVQIGPSSFLPFDSSNGPAPGAEYARPFKTRTWPPIAKDRCKETMLRNRPIARYRNTAMRRSMGSLYQTLSGIRGMGAEICDGETCYDDGSGSSDGDGSFASLLANNPVLANQYAAANSGPTDYVIAPPSTSSSSSSGGSSGAGSSTTGFLTTLANDATALAAPLLKASTTQKPYYITGPNGQSVLYNPNTGTTSTGAAAALQSISPTYLLLGVGLIAALAFAGKGK